MTAAKVCQIALLPGDGIGPEITKEAVKVLDAVSSRFNWHYQLSEGLIGGIAIDKTGQPLPPETLKLCQKSDAVLMGSIGGPKWDTTDPKGVRPEQGLLAIRKELGLFANLRPVKLFPALIEASTLKPEVVAGVDILVVRELTGGLYFGARGRLDGKVFDTLEYSDSEIERVLMVAFQLAQKRNHQVHSVDKANVLESSRRWRELATEVSKQFPDVQLEHMLVDNCAMQLIRHPKQFDVLVTENMFGDILSDEAAMLTGSLGMLASASLGDGSGPALYEPAHGSAPDIAGQNRANPLATILSVALMFRFSFQRFDIAEAIEQAVSEVLAAGYRTPDIAAANCRLVSTEQMGSLVAAAVKE